MSGSAYEAISEVTMGHNPVLTIRIRASDAAILLDASTLTPDRMEALRDMFVQAAREEMKKINEQMEFY